MDFSLAEHKGYVIRQYTGGELLVDDRRVTTSCLLMGHRLEPWKVTQLQDVDKTAMQSLLDWSPELILLGTGKQLHFPARAVREACMQQGVGLEVMDTGAAARTYNLLAADGRQVLAALLV
jgi:uncharacterized protein